MKPKRRGRKTVEQRRKRKAGKTVFPQFVGKVQMTREGYVFVIIDGEEDDVFVRAAKTRGALNGDTVRVAVTKTPRAGGRAKALAGQAARGERREGEIVEIIKRSEKPFVGVFHMVGAHAWVLMQSRFMPYDIEVDGQEALEMGAQTGYKVAALVEGWNRGENCPYGHVVDVLGAPGANETEMHAILAEFNLPYRFEKEVEDAADKIPSEITAADLAERKDFRKTFTFTIDPADAKDFDDALSFRPLENGNLEVGVHIADVSYYVKPGSPVDKEAQDRGTSVYLVDRTVPMLPEKLCNKLCSLRPHEDKLTFSAVFEMTPDAKVRKRWFGRTVINSDFRLDYNQAQSIIKEEIPPLALLGRDDKGVFGRDDKGVFGRDDKGEFSRDDKGVFGRDDKGEFSRDDNGEFDRDDRGVFGRDDSAVISSEVEKSPELVTALKTLMSMALILKDRRRKAGAIDFDRPEMKVKCDEFGKPIEIYQVHSFEANWLIEEFMLLANRSVAEFVSGKGKTFVYRVHDTPNEEKLAGLRTFAKSMGYTMGTELEGRGSANAIGDLLTRAAGRPEADAFREIALRAMAKAKYSVDNIGHYGLAFADYTHFTSPIRRYPDLMVHRLLALYLANGKSQDKDYYAAQCDHASEREAIATDAERTSIKYKLVEYMQDKIGQEFDGHVSGVTEWGMYVEIEPTHIEGMVPLREIKGDFFEFEEDKYRLRGRRTRKIYRLGDPVRIRVSSANLEQRLLDFELLDTEE